MKKRLLAVLSVILTFLMLGGTFSFAANVAPVSSDKFTDVDKGEWYFKYVDWITGNNKDGRDQNGRLNNTPVVCMNGTSETTFEPQTNLTRAMFATILARYDKADVDDSKATIFNDVDVDQWYTGSIGWANEKEIVKGYGDGNFGTMDDISRQDLSLMIIRYIRYYEKTHKVTIKTHGGEWNGDITFTDEDQIRQDEETPKAIKDLVNYGILLGYPDGTVKPTQKITRAETAAIIYRLNWILPTPSGGGGGSTVTKQNYYKVDVTVTAADSKLNTPLQMVYSEANAKNKSLSDIARDLVVKKTGDDKKIYDNKLVLNNILDELVAKTENHSTKTYDGYTVTVADGVISVDGVDLEQKINDENTVYTNQMEKVRTDAKIDNTAAWKAFVQALSIKQLFAEESFDGDGKLKMLPAKSEEENAYYQVVVNAVNASADLYDEIAKPEVFETVLTAAEEYGGEKHLDARFDTLGGVYKILDQQIASPDAIDNTDILKYLGADNKDVLIDLTKDGKNTVFEANETVKTADDVINIINARTSRNWSDRNDIKAILNAMLDPEVEDNFSGAYSLTMTVSQFTK